VKKTIVVGNVSKLVSRVWGVVVCCRVRWNRRLKLGDK